MIEELNMKNREIQQNVEKLKLKSAKMEEIQKKQFIEK